MTEPTADLSDLDRTVLAAVAHRFPVTAAPYCEIGEAVHAPELEVLNSVLMLRQTGVIVRIGVEPTDLPLIDPSDAEAMLMGLLADIPYSERPFDEIAEQMQLRGVEADPEWVLTRTQHWIDEGVIGRIAALT